VPGLHTEVVRASRGEHAFLCGAGVAAALACLRYPYWALLVTGATVGVVAGVALIADLRRGRDWHRQDVLVRQLRTAVRRIPPGYVIADPDTGELISVERERGRLTLAVADRPRPGREQLVTRYLSGHWGAPMPPPLIRHVGAVDDVPPARMSLRQQAWLAEVSTRAGVLQATPAELTALPGQVWRTAVPGTVRSDGQPGAPKRSRPRRNDLRRSGVLPKGTAIAFFTAPLSCRSRARIGLR
jgi:hypothetical protein